MKKGRKPRVCGVCLGNAETTLEDLRCDGDFGGKECGEWLWGWFAVDDTVERAARNYRETNTTKIATECMNYVDTFMGPYAMVPVDELNEWANQLKRL